MQVTMIEVACHVLIKRDGVCILGPVKTNLLREISKTGNLSEAAKVLDISYQHAWTMVEEMNKQAPNALVIKQRGGVSGGSTTVSDYGERVLQEYGLIEAQVQKMMNQINVEINL